jgi:hypothetical protein
MVVQRYGEGIRVLIGRYTTGNLRVARLVISQIDGGNNSRNYGYELTPLLYRDRPNPIMLRNTARLVRHGTA